MSRETAVEKAGTYVTDGPFFAELAERVAVRTESQKPDSLPELHRYLDTLIEPAFRAMGFTCRKFENPLGLGPVLLAERHEGDDLPTVLGYGHGDVIRGLEDQWTRGQGPWILTQDGDRLYGRGTADNKAQHTLNMNALRTVIETRGTLGFNAKFIVETGEETGSKGFREVIEQNMDAFSADVFIASDGPRVKPDRPTLTLGARGAVNFDLLCDLREGGHHSGNWGGLIANPGLVLAHAIASISDRNGAIRVPEWRPERIDPASREVLKDIEIDAGKGGPTIDTDWGEPGLTPPERVYAWNSFEVLAYRTGNPDRPVNAIPPRAWAHCQLRFITGIDFDDIIPALKRHLEREGFPQVQVLPPDEKNAGAFAASATPLENAWVGRIRQSMATTIGADPAIIPSLGGSICNDLFTDLLGLPAIWIPHSYAACSQHAPNEHVLLPTMKSASEIMAGLYWDLGAE
ncbi:M20 family metallopeptidase [Minwuia sp.]|uniref:M20 family metallopeptidase n=1 Tax=Minwuia sp. TaxID=2493630 RepID=UPI003A8D05BC